MTSGIEFALASMLLFGLGDLVYKRGAAAGAQAHQFLMVQSWVFAPSVVAYGIATGTLSFGRASLWGAPVGFFIFVGFYNFAKSLRTGAISINAPVFRLSFVLTAALAVALLHEPLTAYKSAGIALALAAAWLLLGARGARDARKQSETHASLMRVLLATGCVGIGNFIYTQGLRAGAAPASMIVTQAAVVVSLATGFVAAVDGGIRLSGPVLRYAPLAGLALALAFVFMVESMARGQASVSVPIAQMGFVITAILGFVFLAEPFSARKGAGILAALGALASLAHG